MKKLFLALAMTMMFGSIATVFAAEDDLFENGTTKVTYSMDDKYTIVIPSEFALTNEAQEKEVSASDVFIGHEKILQIKINGKNCANDKWYIADENAAANKFEYTITKDGSAIKNGDVILSVDAGTTAGTTETLKFKLAGTVTKAGTYSDLLTFTADVVGMPN